MNKFTIADLATKLGLSRQAIYQAINDGRLYRTVAGLIDIKDERNLAFLGNLDRRQRRGGTEKRVIPNKSAAKLAKYKARYRLWFFRYEGKVDNLIQQGLVDATMSGILADIKAKLRKLPGQMKRQHVLKESEFWLDDRIRAIIRNSPSADRAAADYYCENGPQWTNPGEGLPEKAHAGACIDEVVALLEKLQAARYTLQRAVERGILIKKEEAMKIITATASKVKEALLQLPRRINAQIHAALESGGIRRAAPGVGERN